MISLNDYLYQGDTVLKIIHNYARDLKRHGKENKSPVEQKHYDFLQEMSDLLEHNDFLTSQSQRLRDFYLYMTERYPSLAFTFKGRIKSLVRAEEKYNRYILDTVKRLYEKNGQVPGEDEIAEEIPELRDLIAYRIIVSMPVCHLKEGEDPKEKELECLYDIAERLPGFLEKKQFIPAGINEDQIRPSSRLSKDTAGLFKDYIMFPKKYGYQSLHIVLQDELSGSNIEVQLRTKDMDDLAEIGKANHGRYEKSQEKTKEKRLFREGLCTAYDNAFARLQALEELELADVSVNMFTAVDNHLMNDGCGFYRGRLILPYEHLSRFQNDNIV